MTSVPDRAPPPRPKYGAPAHPFGVALVGGRGEPGLGERIVEALAEEFAVGHVRLDDAPPDEAARPVPSGARATATFFRDGTVAARRERSPGGLFESRYGMIDLDVVLVEGDAGDDAPRVLVLDAAGRPPALAGGGETIATIGLRPDDAEGNVPHYLPDDAAGIAERIRTHLLRRAAATPLHGLVLAGGRSTRMGRPKWALDYRGEPHVRVLHRLLSRFCERTFVSIRPEQRDEPALAELPHVPDRILDAGPVGGIASAMAAHPEAAWIVLACDLPFVDEDTILRLLDRRAPLRYATTYRSPHDGLPEPLCAIYEPKARLRLFEVAALGSTCPRKLLLNAPVRIVESARPSELTNANHPHEYERAAAELHAGGRP